MYGRTTSRNRQAYAVGQLARVAYNAVNRGIPRSAIPAIAGMAIGKTKRLKKYSGRSLRGSKRGTSKQVKKLTTAVRNINRSIHTNTGYLTHKERDRKFLTCNINECAYTDLSPLTVAKMESAISSVPYFEGGTLTNINLTDDTFQRKVNFKSISSSITIRNNRITPCEVRVYVYEAKQATNVGPADTYLSGLIDQMDVSTPNHPMMYPSDVKRISDDWKQVRCVKKMLNAGQQFSVSHTVKNIMYDTSLTDLHGNTYQKHIKSFTFLVRCEGVPATQNNNTDLIGSNDSKLSILMDTVKKIEYDSGSNGTHRYITVNNSDELTDALVAQPTKRLQNSSGIEGY